MAGPIRQPIDIPALEKYIDQHVQLIKTPLDVKQVRFIRERRKTINVLLRHISQAKSINGKRRHANIFFSLNSRSCVPSLDLDNPIRHTY